MKKIIVLLLVLVMVFAFTACQDANKVTPDPSKEAPSEGASSEKEPAEFDGTYVVGLFQPLTGQASLMGVAGNNAAKMAAAEINAAGGIMGKEVVIKSYDDKSSPEEAVKSVNKMIEVDKVNAIIGSLHSGNVQAVGDIVEAAKIPCMGTGTSPQWLQKGWTYMFRPTLNTYYSSLSAIRVCEVLEMKKIGIFYSQDEYGKNGKDNMVDLCEEYGIDILATESMKPGDSDFTAQVANLKKVNPDGLYVIATADNLPPMVKQIRAGGIDGYIFGEQSLGMPEVKKVAGAASDKVVFGACFIMPSTDPAEAQIPEIVDFFTKYRDIYGEMCPSEVAVRCYDALYILKAAVEKAQSVEGTTVRDAIWTISDFKGLQGTFDFTDKSGEGLRESRLYITMDGKDILLDDYLASR